MGSDGGDFYRAGACQGCGKPGAAVIGKSTWGHNFLCCSDTCGERIGAALEAARAEEQYKFFRLLKNHAEQMMIDIERDEIADARMGAGGPEELPDPFSIAMQTVEGWKMAIRSWILAVIGD